MPLNPDSAIDLTVLTALVEEPLSPVAIELEVLRLFDGTSPPLLRYVASFGLSREETEDVVQEVFLGLFRHLRLGRPRNHLRGWLFQVAHNLALRARKKTDRRTTTLTWDDDAAARQVDPAPDPEAQLASAERRRYLRSVLHALPERDRQCVFLRAQGLRYREIAEALDVSLGTVAKSLTRSLTRFVNAEKNAETR